MSDVPIIQLEGSTISSLCYLTAQLTEMRLKQDAQIDVAAYATEVFAKLLGVYYGKE